MKRRRFALMTEGNTTPLLAKMAAGLLRYRGEDVVAVVDSTCVGADVRALLDVPTEVPIVASLADAPQANTIVLGITPPGGALPSSWRRDLLESLRRGLDLWSGLHVFLADDPDFAAAAREGGASIRDLRFSPQRPIAQAKDLDDRAYRLLTVGQDVCVGKMCVALEVSRCLEREHGRDAPFLATGQTGIAIADHGAPLDALPADFVAGAAEALVLEAQAPGRILIGEGQGSLAHPSFSGVTLSLLHGFAPQGLIFCLEAERPHTKGLAHVPLAPIETMVARSLEMAALRAPAELIGFGINSRRLSESDARALCSQIEDRFKVPATDVLRFGPRPLAEAVLRACGDAP